MSGLQPDDVEARLQALYDDLQRLPTGAYCPWPVARLFNKLLEQARIRLGDDPVIAVILTIKQHPAEQEPDAGHMTVGAMLVLIGQLRAALAAG